MGTNSNLRRYSKLAHRLGLSSLVIGIGAAVIKAWVTHWLSPGPITPATPPAAPAVVAMASAAAPAVSKQKTVEDLLASSPITLMDWQIAVEQKYDTPAQRERQFRNYLGREVVWEGYFDQSHQLPGDTPERTGYTLILQESRAALFSQKPLGPPSVRCWCPESAGPQLAKLERGQWLVVKGRLKSPLLLGSLLCTDLSDCEIVATSDIRNVEMALSPEQGTIQR
jgi:hypothetical protein